MSFSPVEALRAIKARIEGRFDNPDLLRVGALHTDPLDDIAMILGMVDTHERDRHGHRVAPIRI